MLSLHLGGCDSSTHTCTCNEGWMGAGCEYADCNRAVVFTYSIYL